MLPLWMRIFKNLEEQARLELQLERMGSEGARKSNSKKSKVAPARKIK